MKKPILALIMALIITGVTSCCYAKNTQKDTQKNMISPDSVAYVHLGKTLAETLFSPTKVKVYTLKGVEKVEEGAIEIEDHYVRDSLIATLDANQTAILQYLLLCNEENYQNDSVPIRSPYIPAIEFEFTKKKSEPAHIVISLSDRTWTIMYDEKKQFNWNYANKKLIDRFCTFFLKPVYDKKEEKR